MTDERSLARLFHGVILASLGTPGVLAASGCGGSTTSVATDAGKRDAPVAHADSGRVDAAQSGDANSCQPSGCGGCTCGPGCVSTFVCVNGVSSPACNCDAGIDAGLSCSPDRSTGNFYLPLDCLDGGLPGDASALTQVECRTLCGSSGINTCGLVEASGGQSVLGCYTYLAAGRRPAGYSPRRGASRVSVGRVLAQMAELEAASVPAFHALEAELRAHGAPLRLRAAARRAARDEVRHAEKVGELAHQHGCAPRRPKVRAARARTLEAMAIENAVEGCVRETFGALVATLQAGSAEDPAVRDLMGRIAKDETRHAALAWAVSRWADRRLDAAARVRVLAARRTAVDGLLDAARQNVPRGVRGHLGLPDAAATQRLVREMSARLWG